MDVWRATDIAPNANTGVLILLANSFRSAAYPLQRPVVAEHAAKTAKRRVAFGVLIDIRRLERRHRIGALLVEEHSIRTRSFPASSASGRSSTALNRKCQLLQLEGAATDTSALRVCRGCFIYKDDAI